MRAFERRTRQAGQAAGYLLSSLLTAVMSLFLFPFLCHPALRRVWADWHQQRAARLRHNPRQPTRPVAIGRYLSWLAAHVMTSLPAGLLALFCLGNILLATVVIPLWWLFPTDDPPPVLFDLTVTTWETALILGAAQFVILTAVVYVVLPRVARTHASIALALLSPSPPDWLADQIAMLTRTRLEVLEAHGAELRRIERDLHDGIQARLVAVAMRLASARRLLASDEVLATKLMREAQEVTEEAMTELRDVLVTIYPPILADRGLAGALKAVAARGAIPIDVDVGQLERIPAAVEAVAYYVVTEALTNVAKHSRAREASVLVRQLGDRLSIMVSDDGAGGARETGGSGLTGIRSRVCAFDGSLGITSPVGGPTRIEVELPCGW